MKKTFLLLSIALIVNVESVSSANFKKITLTNSIKNPKDSIRLAELDRYWAKLTKTVKEGDFEGFKSLYHSDAVVVFTYGKNKVSMPMKDVLPGWKKGFDETKQGKQNDDVQFRFSQRIGNENSAHETGIFVFTSKDLSGKIKTKLVLHFEMLLVKKNNNWYALMEYQKSEASQEEWDALKQT